MSAPGTPPRTVDEAEWKRRFLASAGVKLAGTALIVAGMFVGFTDLARNGGWPAAGLVLALAGLVLAFWWPRRMSARWRRDDAANPGATADRP